MRIGPSDRSGYTPLANAETERLFNELTPVQFRLYVGLRIEAQYGEPCERRDAFGRPVLLEVGEVLFGIDSAAARYGLSRDQVRRAIERFEQLGLVRRREGVAAATPRDAGTATPRGRDAATAPSVITFLTDRETCWRAKRAAIPPEPQAATPPEAVAAPIQDTTQNTEPTKAEASAAAPRPLRAKRGNDAEDTPVARELRRIAEAAFLELRGEPYTLATKGAIIADRVAARSLLAAAGGDLSVVCGRWRAALVHEGFPRVDTLADLAKHWPRFSAPPSAARLRVGSAARPRSPESGCPEWDGALAAARRAAGEGSDFVERLLMPLRPRMVGDALELRAPEGFPAAFLREKHGANLAAWVAEGAGRHLEVRLLDASPRAASGGA